MYVCTVLFIDQTDDNQITKDLPVNRDVPDAEAFLEKRHYLQAFLSSLHVGAPSPPFSSFLFFFFFTWDNNELEHMH